MKTNNEKFCPLLSTAEKKVSCTKECAFFSYETQLGRCIIHNLSENISQLSMDIATFDIYSLEESKR